MIDPLGPIEEAAERLAKLNLEAVTVAKFICEELGEDPTGLSLSPDGNGFALQNWELRYEYALLAIAQWRAVHRWALTQA